MTQLQQTRQHLPIAGGTLPTTKLWGHRPRQQYLSKTLGVSFEDGLTRVTQALRARGFRVLTEVDVQATLSQERAVNLPPFRILCASDPALAYRTLQLAGRTSTLLFSNVVVQKTGEEQIQIAVIDPTSLAEVRGNPALATIARQLRKKLWAVIRTL
jgi:uncharacterized protein (DUF302 family)